MKSRPFSAALENTVGEVNDSELRQSLWVHPATGNGVYGITPNVVWGYYADGFFDRRAIYLTKAGYFFIYNDSKGVAPHSPTASVSGWHDGIGLSGTHWNPALERCPTTAKAAAP